MHEPSQSADDDVLWKLSFGPLEGRVSGRPDGMPAIVLHGMNPALDVVWEWERAGITTVLTGAGYKVIAPNFHSNSKLAPKVIDFETFDRVMFELMSQLEVHEGFVLLGKSWGGAMAAQWATRNPHMVRQLVLCAPALRDEAVAASLSMPTWLGWCRDDRLIPIEKSKLFAGAAKLTMYEAEKGGHTIVPEYAEPILSFLADNV